MTEIFRIEGSGVDSELVEGLASRVADPLWVSCAPMAAGRVPRRGCRLAGDSGRGRDRQLSDRRLLGSGRAPPRQRRHAPSRDRRSRLWPSGTMRTSTIPSARDWESGASLLRRLRRAGIRDAFAAALMAAYRVTIGPKVDQSDPVGLERLKILAGVSCDGRLIIGAIAAGQGIHRQAEGAVGSGQRRTAGGRESAGRLACGRRDPRPDGARENSFRLAGRRTRSRSSACQPASRRWIQSGSRRGNTRVGGSTGSTSIWSRGRRATGHSTL